ncbi:MAG: hypothetical protein WDN45_17125 [Caulobacteraceae bacterium]
MSDQVEAVEAPSIAGASRSKGAGETVFGIIAAVGVCHGLNDMMQSLLPAIYPEFKTNFGLTFGQIGLVTLCYQITASILQPLIGWYADKRPTPHGPARRGPVLAPGPDDPVLRPQLRRHPRRRLRARHGFGGVPPGILARRPHGGGVPPGPGPTGHVPGRRQSRLGHRPPGGRRLRGALRPAEPESLRPPGADLLRHPLERRGLVQAPRPGAAEGRRQGRQRLLRPCPRARRRGAW